MNKSRAISWGLRITGLAVWVMWGCSPVTESERQYFEFRERDQQQQQAFMQKMGEANNLDEAVQMVKEELAPDGEDTTEEWVLRELSRQQGDVLFPRWEGTRKGSNRFEVQFSYTHRDTEYRISKKGYTWEVDTRLQMVSGPEEWVEDDLDPRPYRTTVHDELDVVHEEFSLE